MNHVVENQLLNDNCIMEIFESLLPADLLSVAQVSIQFNRVARHVFRIKYSDFRIHDHFRALDDTKITQIFRNFGDLMKKLDLIPLFYPWHSMRLQKRTIELIQKYCMAENISELKLSDFSNIDKRLEMLFPMFERLEILELKRVTLSLSTLELLRQLPNAKRVKLIFCLNLYDPNIENIKTESFVNENLKELILIHYEESYVVSVLSVINTAFPNLEFFTFRGLSRGYRIFTRDVINIAFLPKLMKLDIDFSYNYVESLLCNMSERNTTLNCLTLSEATISQTAIDALCKIKSISELFILDSFQISEQNILKIVSELSNLKTLSIMTNEISIDTLYNIVAWAKKMTKGEFKISARMKLENRVYDKIHKLTNGRSQNLKLCIHKECNYNTFQSELYLLNMSEKPNLTISRIYNASKSILADTPY